MRRSDDSLSTRPSSSSADSNNNAGNSRLSPPSSACVARRHDQNVRLDDLDVVCTIGMGTFGRVDLAQLRTTDEFVALKVLNIHKVVQTRQVAHVHGEKNALIVFNHPFIVNFLGKAQDDRNLYLMMEFAPGGELFSYLRALKVFTISMARFYAAECAVALGYMHERGYCYRDLKPENLLLARDGHIKITDLGFAKKLRGKTFTLCGTPEYLAPETLGHKGQDFGVDWWALGVLIFEMLAGRPPFRGNTSQIYDAILAHNLDFTPAFNDNAKRLCEQLLTISPTARLGFREDVAEIAKHPFFELINFDDISKLRVSPPVLPTLFGEGDCGNFDTFDDQPLGDMASQRERDQFRDW